MVSGRATIVRCVKYLCENRYVDTSFLKLEEFLNWPVFFLCLLLYYSDVCEPITVIRFLLETEYLRSRPIELEDNVLSARAANLGMNRFIIFHPLLANRL